MIIDKALRQKMVRTPQALEWARFKHHATRVRILRIDTYYSDGEEGDFNRPDMEVDRSCYEALATCFPHGSVFPHLQTLYWFHQSLSQYVRLFIAPSLKKAEADYHLCFDDKIIHYLEILASSAPSLKEFLFEEDGLPDTPEVSAAFSRALCRFHHLTRVNVFTDVSHEALHHLASLPRLQYLHFIVVSANYRTIFSSLEGPKFAALRSLYIVFSQDDIERLVHFVNAIDSKLLTDLMLNSSYSSSDKYAESLSSQHLHSVFSAVSKFKSLTSLHVTAWQAEPIISGPTLEPLLRLTRLRYLYLSGLPLFLESSDFQAIARAYPCMVELKIDSHYECRAACSATLEDLLLFARHCPSLQTLDVSVACNGTEIHPHELVSEGLPHSVLSTLHLGKDTTIEDPMVFAAFLSGVFPRVNLAYLSWLMDERESWAQNIEETKRLMRGFCAVRSQERDAAARRTERAVQAVRDGMSA